MSAPRATAPHSGAQVAIAVVATLVVQAGVALLVFTAPVIAPAAHRDIGVDATAVGLFTSTIYALAAFSALACAAPVARWGGLRVRQAALLLCAGGMLLVASASLPLVVLGALLMGLGYGPVTPAAAVILVRRLPPGYRALGFSIKQTGVPIGAGAAGLAVPLLVGWAGWQAAVLALAAVCAATALACQPIRDGIDRETRGSGPAATHSPAGALRIVRDNPALRELSIGSFAFSGLQMCLIAYLVVYLIEAAGITLVAAGLAMTCAMAGGLVGRIAWGWVADRLVAPRRVLSLLSLGMAAVAVALAWVTPGWPMAAILALSVCVGATVIGWNGVYLSELAHTVPPGLASVATAGSMFVTYAGVTLWPAVFWAVHQATGSYLPPFAMVAALAVAAAVMFARPAPGAT